MSLLVGQLFTSVPYPSGSVEGKTIIVTGGNTGLGKEAARHYARLGAKKLIIASRNIDKGEAAKYDIEQSTGCGDGVIEVWHLDMSSYDNVKIFAARVASDLDRVDIFNANAGVAKAEWHEIEGEEETIVVNVISTFLLAALILPKMKETAKLFNTRPTFCFTTSGAHVMSKFPQRTASEGQIFNTLNNKAESEKSFDERYPLSKMLEIFAVRSIAEQAPASSFPVTINMVCPGFCHSDLSREHPTITFAVMKFLFARTSEQGGRPIVDGGMSGADRHCAYLSNCKVSTPGKIVTENKQTQDRLWKELTAKLEAISPGCTQAFRP